MRCVIVATALASLTVLTSSTHATLLYDGALGTAPTAQGLFFLAVPSGSYQTTAGGATTLNTSAAEGIYAGYSLSSSLTLDRTSGFTVRVDARILASTATNPDRAGFSLIALGSDKQGIEIGFHGNEVFSQQGGTAPALFTRGQAASFDTSSLAHRYDLTILGNTYTLRADGSPILTGPTQDYTQFAGAIDPYETPNFLFIGDDSTSASGSTSFSYVGVSVPEPTVAAIAFGALGFGRRRR